MSHLIKTPEEIANIRESGRILSMALRKIRSVAAPGVSLLDLDNLARSLIVIHGGAPAFLGYRPEGARSKYPFTLCTSVNNVIVHGRPSSYLLKSGDVLKLDLGVNWHGGITDAALTVPIGTVGRDALRLIKVTEHALKEAIRFVKPGNTLGDIGFAIHRTVSAGNFKVIDGLTGHGVGIELHEDPIIYNYGKPGHGMVLKEGMVLAIEPMTSLTTSKAVQLNDDSFATSDNSLSAHFESTVLVVKKSCEVLAK